MTCRLTLPPLDADANKYSRGKLVVVAGSDRYTGAAVLAARASERMGSGYTEVVTTAAAVPIVRGASASLVVRDVASWRVEELPEAREGKPCAVCLGPGFEGSDIERVRVRRILKQASCPVLVDGGALACLAAKKTLRALALRAERELPTVITPHGGEAARLAEGLGLDCADPESLAGSLASELHAIAVVKGPVTSVSDGQVTLSVDEGTPALAKAGTGDVLAGMIGSLLAQGMEPLLASYVGVTIHARAGRLASEQLAERSVVAEDLIACIPAIIKEK